MSFAGSTGLLSATGATHVRWLGYLTAVAEMALTLTREQKGELSLTASAEGQAVAASPQCQASNAIAVLPARGVLATPSQTVDALRTTRPAHLRHAPTVAGTRAPLQAVRGVAHPPSLTAWRADTARLRRGCTRTARPPPRSRPRSPGTGSPRRRRSGSGRSCEVLDPRVLPSVTAWVT